MIKYLFSIFAILFFTSQIFPQDNLQRLIGAYQWCPFPCETIKLNGDFTFEYLIDGDLFNNERTKGAWKFVSENKINLKSPERKLVYKTTEKQNAIRNNILIQVVDFQGAVIPGIIIKVNVQGQEKNYLTDENGTCEIPRTDEIKVDWIRFSEKYKVANSQTDELFIEIELTNEPSIDDTFIFKNGRLFKISGDNNISENGYKKLNKKVVRKLFPEK